MSTSSILAFHAPHLDLSELKNGPSNPSTPKAVIEAYNQAVAEMAKGLLQLAERRTTEAIVPLVPASLMSQALLKTGTEMLAIDTTGQAIRWNISVEDHANVVPTSKDDVIQACRIAQAQVNEDWERAIGSNLEEYIAYYNSTKRVLIAQVILSGPDQDACEIKIEYDQDLRRLARPISVKANLTFEDRLGLRWIKDMRDSKSVDLPALALLSPTTALKDVAARYEKRIDPASLATLGTPQWCNSQATKGTDEQAVCRDDELSAFDMLLNYYYKILLGKLGSFTQKGRLNAEAAVWRAKRKRCGEKVACLDQVYREAMDNLQERIWAVEVEVSHHRCHVSGCAPSDADVQPAPPP